MWGTAELDSTTAEPAKKDQDQNVPPPVIRLEDLAKFYKMGTSVVHALDGVSATINRGEFVSIAGASGSGKSTIMHLIGCLEQPTRGWYELNGQRVSDFSQRELAAVRNKEIGFVFQTFNLINRTSALDNVALPLFYARETRVREPAMKALDRVGMAHRSRHRSNELSGGERQRVAIARALVNEPALVLADEPTGNLDSRTGVQIMRLFRELNDEGVTVVIVTHDAGVASQTRRIITMRDGKIVTDRENANPTRPALPPVSESPIEHDED